MTDGERRQRARRQAEGRSAGYWFKTPNDFFDWNLPPEFRASQRLVWLAFNRHANSRPDRVVKKITQELIAKQTGLSKRTVEQAINFLTKAELLELLRKGGAWRGGRRLTAVYRVPDLSTLAKVDVMRGIRRAHRAR